MVELKDEDLDFKRGTRKYSALGWALALSVSIGLGYLSYSDARPDIDDAHAFLRAVREGDEEAVLARVSERLALQIRQDGLVAWAEQVRPGLLANEDATLPSVGHYGTYSCVSGVIHTKDGMLPISFRLEYGKVDAISRRPTPPPSWGCYSH